MAESFIQDSSCHEYPPGVPIHFSQQVSVSLATVCCICALACSAICKTDPKRFDKGKCLVASRARAFKAVTAHEACHELRASPGTAVALGTSSPLQMHSFCQAKDGIALESDGIRALKRGDLEAGFQASRGLQPAAKLAFLALHQNQGM